MLLAHMSRKRQCVPLTDQVVQSKSIKPNVTVDDPLVTLNENVQMLIGMVTAQQVLIQELICTVNTLKASKVKIRPLAIKDVQSASILQQEENNKDIEDQTDIIKTLHTPRNNMITDMCKAETMQQAIDIVTTPIIQIKYPFRFNEETGEIINKTNGRIYGDIHKTARVLYDTMMKAAFKIAKEMMPTMSETSKALWTDIMETNEETYRILCMNIISRHVGELVL
jgi:hypothetical protein